MDMDCVICKLGFELLCIIKSNASSVLFWAVTQLVMLIPYDFSGQPIRLRLQGLRIQEEPYFSSSSWNLDP